MNLTVLVFISFTIYLIFCRASQLIKSPIQPTSYLAVILCVRIACLTHLPMSTSSADDPYLCGHTGELKLQTQNCNMTTPAITHAHWIHIREVAVVEGDELCESERERVERTRHIFGKFAVGAPLTFVHL